MNVHGTEWIMSGKEQNVDKNVSHIPLTRLPCQGMAMCACDPYSHAVTP